ncbi:MAG: hypothetical protein ACYC1M_15390 [Armatimonadota bacterium]
MAKPRLITKYAAWLIAMLAAFMLIGLACAQQTATVPAQTTAKTNLAAQFTSATGVMLFVTDTGQWQPGSCAQAKPGSEFLYNNKLYRVLNSNTVNLIPGADAAKLFEAARPSDKTSRLPTPKDIVQLLDKNRLPVSHDLLSVIPAGSTVGFQGRAYTLKADRSVAPAKISPAILSMLQHIEVTTSSWQHIMDRHTAGGAKNAGASTFNGGEDIKALIKQAEIVTPEIESNGYVSRDYDAGHIVGYDDYRYDKRKNRQTSTIKVIATQTGKLVTCYPVVK